MKHLTRIAAVLLAAALAADPTAVMASVGLSSDAMAGSRPIWRQPLQFPFTSQALAPQSASAFRPPSRPPSVKIVGLNPARALARDPEFGNIFDLADLGRALIGPEQEAVELALGTVHRHAFFWSGAASVDFSPLFNHLSGFQRLYLLVAPDGTLRGYARTCAYDDGGQELSWLATWTGDGVRGRGRFFMKSLMGLWKIAGVEFADWASEVCSAGFHHRALAGEARYVVSRNLAFKMFPPTYRALSRAERQAQRIRLARYSARRDAVLAALSAAPPGPYRLSGLENAGTELAKETGGRWRHAGGSLLIRREPGLTFGDVVDALTYGASAELTAQDGTKIIAPSGIPGVPDIAPLVEAAAREQPERGPLSRLNPAKALARDPLVGDVFALADVAEELTEPQLDALAQGLAAVNAGAFRHEEPTEADIARFTVQLRENPQDLLGYYVLISPEGLVRGYALTAEYPSTRDIWLSRLATLPQDRALGLGTYLLGALMARWKTQRVEAVDLAAVDDSPAFYLGFTADAADFFFTYGPEFTFFPSTYRVLNPEQRERQWAYADQWTSRREFVDARLNDMRPGRYRLLRDQLPLAMVQKDDDGQRLLASEENPATILVYSKGARLLSDQESPEEVIPPLGIAEKRWRTVPVASRPPEKHREEMARKSIDAEMFTRIDQGLSWDLPVVFRLLPPGTPWSIVRMSAGAPAMMMDLSQVRPEEVVAAWRSGLDLLDASATKTAAALAEPGDGNFPSAPDEPFRSDRAALRALRRLCKEGLLTAERSVLSPVSGLPLSSYRLALVLPSAESGAPNPATVKIDRGAIQAEAQRLRPQVLDKPWNEVFDERVRHAAFRFHDRGWVLKERMWIFIKPFIIAGRRVEAELKKTDLSTGEHHLLEKQRELLMAWSFVLTALRKHPDRNDLRRIGSWEESSGRRSLTTELESSLGRLIVIWEFIDKAGRIALNVRISRRAADGGEGALGLVTINDNALGHGNEDVENTLHVDMGLIRGGREKFFVYGFPVTKAWSDERAPLMIRDHFRERFLRPLQVYLELLRELRPPDRAPGAFWLQEVTREAIAQGLLGQPLREELAIFLSRLLSPEGEPSEGEIGQEFLRQVPSLTADEALERLGLRAARSEKGRTPLGRAVKFLYVRDASAGNDESRWDNLLRIQRRPAPLGVILHFKDGPVVLLPQESFDQMKPESQEFIRQHELLEVDGRSHAGAVLSQGIQAYNRHVRLARDILSPFERDFGPWAAEVLLRTGLDVHSAVGDAVEFLRKSAATASAYDDLTYILKQFVLQRTAAHQPVERALRYGVPFAYEAARGEPPLFRMILEQYQNLMEVLQDHRRNPSSLTEVHLPRFVRQAGSRTYLVLSVLETLKLLTVEEVDVEFSLFLGGLPDLVFLYGDDVQAWKTHLRHLALADLVEAVASRLPPEWRGSMALRDALASEKRALLADDPSLAEAHLVEGMNEVKRIITGMLGGDAVEDRRILTAVEQLVVLSVIPPVVPRELDDLGFGSFRKTMHWIARMGVEENTGRFKPLLEAMEDYAFYYPKNTNPLGLLTSLSWKMLVAAAQKYVEAEPYVTQAAQFPGPDYGLTDALHFQPESTYGVKVRTPLGAHAFSAWFRSQVVPRLRDAGLMTAGEFPLIEPVSSSLAYVLFQARDPAAIRRLLETYGRHEFTVELDRTSA